MCPRVMYINPSLIAVVQNLAILDPFGTQRDAGSSQNEVDHYYSKGYTISLKTTMSSVSGFVLHSVYMLIFVCSDPR